MNYIIAFEYKEFMIIRHCCYIAYIYQTYKQITMMNTWMDCNNYESLLKDSEMAYRHVQTINTIEIWC